VIVVIDTNVWISALQFAKHRGTPALALERAMSEDVIATCDEIDEEIVRVLTVKFSWEQQGAASALKAILARGIRVKIRGTVKVCRDPHDEMFLECAALPSLFICGEFASLLRVLAGSLLRICCPKFKRHY
jgi:putative PIN family toxin of toxin-antitoxin system